MEKTAELQSWSLMNSVESHEICEDSWSLEVTRFPL